MDAATRLPRNDAGAATCVALGSPKARSGIAKAAIRDQSVAATFLPCLDKLWSITVRQPVLNWARCLIMHAVIAGMFGISELQRRNASPVHICCSSELNAKLWLVDSAETETANANTKPAWRILRVKDAFIFGSHWHRVAGPLFDGTTMRPAPHSDCDGSHDSSHPCDDGHIAASAGNRSLRRAVLGRR